MPVLEPLFEDVDAGVDVGAGFEGTAATVACACDAVALDSDAGAVAAATAAFVRRSPAAASGPLLA